MNVEDQLRAYGSMLDERRAVEPEATELTGGATRRPSNRRRALLGVGATALAISVAIGIASARSPHPLIRAATTPRTTNALTTAPTLPADLPRRFSVIRTFTGTFASRPIVMSDGDIWLVQAQSASRAGASVERRDATTGVLKATITIPKQEGVVAIAADASGHVYVAGGGDGGVPQTAVSRISTATNHLDYTVTLPADATCSCQLAATPDAVWLAANGTGTAIALDPTTARVVAVVPLPARATALSAVGSTIDIGMANSQVAVIDPATKRVAHVDDIGDSTTELAGRIVAISPYRATATSWNAWVTRGDGTNMVLLPNGKTIRPGTLPVAPDATTTTASGDLLYVVAGNELAIRSSKHDTVGVARYDSSTSTFSDVVASTGNAVATPGGFDYVISAGGSIWVKFGDSPGGEVLLIRPR